MPDEQTSNFGPYLFFLVALTAAGAGLVAFNMAAHRRKHDAGLVDNRGARGVQPALTTIQNAPFTKTKALTAPLGPAATLKYYPIDCSSAFNADVLGKLANLKYEARAPIPGVVPRAYFHLGPLGANNAVQLNDTTTISLPAEKRGKFREIAFLHGADGHGGTVDVTLHYATGGDEALQLQVLNWHAKNRKEPPETREFATVQTLSADGRLEAELFSQEFSVDPARVLESIALSKCDGAAIVGITAIPDYDVK